MKIRRILLKNFASVYAGMGKHKVEIRFDENANPITLLIGKNGSGKTSILSNMHPFPYVETGDIRNSQDLILKDKEGRKELDIQDGDTTYKIDIHYQLVRDKRQTRCFIYKNGIALNPTGLVRSYYDVLKTEFNIDPSLLRIIRLGPNVADLISMKATERKDFISGFLSDVEVYDRLFAVARDESIYLRSQLKVITTNYDKIDHISTLEHERTKCDQNIKALGERINQYISNLAVLTNEAQNTAMSSKEIDEAFADYNDIKKTLSMYNSVDDKKGLINKYNELTSDIDKSDSELVQKSNHVKSLNASLVDVERRINEYKKKLEILQANSVDGNIDDAISSYEEKLQAVDCKPTIAQPERYELILSLWKDVLDMIESISDIHVFNTYKKYMAYSVEDTVVDDIMDGIDKQISKLEKQIAVMGLGSYVYKDLISGMVLYVPEGCTDPQSCPFYQAVNSLGSMNTSEQSSLADMLQIYKTAKDRIYTLRMISKNISAINNFNTEIYISFGQILGDMVSFKSDGIRKIDTEIQEVLSQSRDFALAETYRSKLAELRQRKKDLDSVGVLSIIQDEMETLSKQKDSLIGEISDEEGSIDTLSQANQELMTERLLIEPGYQAVIDYTSNLAKYTEIQQRYEKAKVVESVMDDLSRKIKNVSVQIESLKNSRDDENSRMIDLVHKIKTKESLEKQMDIIQERFSYVELVRDALSSTKGIPLVFIQLYLKNIQILANSIIHSMFSDDEIQLKDFIITDKEFSIPYIVNGIEVADVSYSSQGERATIVLALSFALLHQMMGRYNILLLDEIDSALYKDNRRRFIKIVEEQMKLVGCEQAFMITHNNLFENYPVDIILTSDLEDMTYNKGRIIWSPKGEQDE